MKLRVASRLRTRLLAFNLLLVFLPISGVLLLGEYESRLETAEIRSMTAQARLVTAMLARSGTLDADLFEDTIRRAAIGDVRMRLIDRVGHVVADSQHIVATPVPQPRTDRHNVLYRFGAFLIRPVARLVRPPEAPLPIDAYHNSAVLSGPEIAAALRGSESFEKRITAQGQRSVTLYKTVPVIVGGWSVGAVVASKSTFTILQDLYAVRLRVMRIFLASVAAAILLSIFFSTTIVRPLRQLRVDARAILDRRGRIRGHFKGSKRHDEIGQLSRALERIMRRLDARVKFIETFASDVSHELKNPLASIRNANEMAAEVGDPADRRRFVRIIDEEVARMERLLSGVREISVLDAELVRETTAEVDLAALLTKIVEGFRLREPNVTFALELTGEALLVEASEDRLFQIFENLLDNAVSFSPRESVVTIRAYAEGESVIASVADQGPGIPPANLARIFDRFFTHRTDATRRGSAHTGLGLAIVKSIVDAYGGTVSAANEESGGAVMTIRLPR
ncbi:MAG TPA: ATP-binding protein [Thermoanaerobaculia bacterium]|nr:ATP-binding protein [Thermoanaerobaculia bacterium]